MKNNEVEQLKKIAQKSMGKMSECATFLGICSDKFSSDPVCLIQLSLAILMDKPLFLLINKKVKPSKNLIRILEGYEFYEDDNKESFEIATKKLTQKVKKYMAKVDNGKGQIL